MKHKGWYSNMHTTFCWCGSGISCMVCSYLTCTGHTYYPSPSTHYSLTRMMGGEGGERHDTANERAHPDFMDKQMVASEVTGPTWFSSQCMKYGHQDTYWTMQSLSITGAHTSPSLAFTDTPHFTHIPPPLTLLTFRTVFYLCFNQLVAITGQGSPSL